ncbi:MAG: serine/threonine-protein kinase [Planctomycetota bacterium]|jgi:serine/threonine protein kinase
MSATVREVQKAIEQNDLLSSTSLEKFLQQHKDEGDGKRLAELFVRDGLLTRWQAKFLLQNKAELLTLGSYILLDRLGAGGMGVVFKAKHRTMDRTVAIKTLHPEVARKKETISRFYREVKAAAKLVHKNIVTAYDAGEERNIHFLVMEYVRGRDLGQIVKEAGPIPWRQAVDLVLQAASGLAHAHSKGLVHRDIKPSNLLLDRDATVKVLDLGLARLVAMSADEAEAAGEDITHAGQVMGTMDYMAPEQAEDISGVDQRADIYSLGCTLYYLVTGQPMYPGKTLLNKMMAHRQKPIPALANDDAPVPAGIDAVFRRMVAKDPDERFQTMAEVIDAFTHTLQNLSQSDSGESDASASTVAKRLAMVAANTHSETAAFSEMSNLKGGATGSSFDLDGSSEMALPWEEKGRWHEQFSPLHWGILAVAVIAVSSAVLLIEAPKKDVGISRPAEDDDTRPREPRVRWASTPDSPVDIPEERPASEAASETDSKKESAQEENSFSF